MLGKQLVVNNLLLNYLEQKVSDTAQTVVFLHGWKASVEIWKPIIERLLRSPRNDKTLNIYALDLPGFGKSEMPKQAMTVGDYAGIVNEFLAKLGLKNIILVGHSFGGRIAQKCSAEHLLTIEKLILVDSAGFKDESWGKMIKIAAAKIAKPFVPAGLKNKLSKAVGAEDYADSGELKQTFLNTINEDQTEDIKKIAVPTLIIWGADDTATPVEFGRRMNSLIRNSKLEILPQAGHYSFLDKPDEFLKLLVDFI